MSTSRYCLFLLLSALAIPCAAQKSRINWVAAGHKGAISSISYAPNDSFFVSAAYGDSHVIIWDGITGKFRSWFDFDSTLQCVKVSPDSRTLALANDSELFLLDLASQQILKSIRDTTTIHIQTIAFSPTGDTLAWVSFSKTYDVNELLGLVTRYSMSKGTLTSDTLTRINARSIDGVQHGTPGEFLFTKELDRLAFTGQIGIGMYSFRTASLLFIKYYGLSNGNRCCFVSGDSQLVVTTSLDSIAILDARTGATLLSHLQPWLNGPYPIQDISPDTIVICSGSAFHLMQLSTLDTITSIAPGQSPMRVWDWSPHRDRLAIGIDHSIEIMEGPPPPPIITLYHTPAAFSSQLVTQVANNLNSVRTSPTTTDIAAGSFGRLCLLDSNDNVLNGVGGDCGSLAFNHTGTRIAATFDNYVTGGGSTSILDVKSFTIVSGTTGSMDNLMNYSPFSQFSFSLADDTLATGDTINSIPFTSSYDFWPYYTCLNSFTPDGSRLFYSYTDIVRVKDMATRRVVDSFQTTHGHINAFRLNHNGSLLLTCGTDGLIRMWKTSDHSLIRTFGGYKASVTGVQFSPSESYVISSSLDSTIRIWDITTGVVVDSFTEFRAPYTDVQVTQDGRYILASSPLALVEYGSPKVPLESVKQSGSNSFVLGDAYPNPFSTSSTVTFSLSRREFVTLRIVNILGETMAIPLEGFYDLGKHSMRIDKSSLHLTPGVYLYELATPEGSMAKMLQVE
jgi:WD40 repeat protein